MHAAPATWADQRIEEAVPAPAYPPPHKHGRATQNSALLRAGISRHVLPGRLPAGHDVGATPANPVPNPMLLGSRGLQSNPYRLSIPSNWKDLNVPAPHDVCSASSNAGRAIHSLESRNAD